MSSKFLTVQSRVIPEIGISIQEYQMTGKLFRLPFAEDRYSRILTFFFAIYSIHSNIRLISEAWGSMVRKFQDLRRGNCYNQQTLHDIFMKTQKQWMFTPVSENYIEWVFEVGFSLFNNNDPATCCITQSLSSLYLLSRILLFIVTYLWA